MPVSKTVFALHQFLFVAGSFGPTRLPPTETLFHRIEISSGWKLDAAWIQFVAGIVLRFEDRLLSSWTPTIVELYW
jgi:hypothetical protein